jgi:branched-chain amino acid aminotransferase
MPPARPVPHHAVAPASTCVAPEHLSGETPTAAPLERAICWVNGLPANPDAPALPVSDRGFTLADGCFETMRAYGGVIFCLDAHMQRLSMTAARLGIPVPPHLEQTLAAALRALRAVRADASVRLTISRGTGAGLAAPSGAVPTTVLLIGRLPAVPATLDTAGLTARIASGRRNEHAPSAGLKTLSYTDAVMALTEARASGADEALLLDTAGHLCDGSSSNLFLVAGGIVRTPPRSCGILPGITRETVLGILQSLGITAEEVPILPVELDTADEVFLTSSLREIAPVTRIGEQPVGSGRPGPLAGRVKAAYRGLVASAIADEFDGTV